MFSLKTSVLNFTMVNLVNKSILTLFYYYRPLTRKRGRGGMTGGVGGRRGEGSPLPVLSRKLEKSFQGFGKKCPDCGHFSFKMQFLSFSRRKTQKFLFCRWNIYESTLSLRKNPALTNYWLRVCTIMAYLRVALRKNQFINSLVEHLKKSWKC